MAGERSLTRTVFSNQEEAGNGLVTAGGKGGRKTPPKGLFRPTRRRAEGNMGAGGRERLTDVSFGQGRGEGVWRLK